MTSQGLRWHRNSPLFKKVVPQQIPERHTVVGPKRSTGAELAVKSDILLGGEICELLACELAADYPSLPREQLEQAK